MAIITFLTVLAWIIFGFNNANNTSTIDDTAIKNIVPLTPTFDSDIIKQLNERGQF